MAFTSQKITEKPEVGMDTREQAEDMVTVEIEMGDTFVVHSSEENYDFDQVRL